MALTAVGLWPRYLRGWPRRRLTNRSIPANHQDWFSCEADDAFRYAAKHQVIKSMPPMGTDNDKIRRPTLGLFIDRVANALCQDFKNDEFCVDFGSGLTGRRGTSRQHLLARLPHCLLVVGNRIRDIHFHIGRCFVNHMNKPQRGLLLFG